MRLHNLLLALPVALGACRAQPRTSVPPADQAAAGATSAAPAERVDSTSPRGHPGDVRFMQGMIGHHAQALTMTALVGSRTSRADMRLLAERIEVSQKDEIRLMQQWLRKHRETVPVGDAHQHAGMSHSGAEASAHHPGMSNALMPGMLTGQELSTLSAASGSAFDVMFLRLMIRHHEGAITMVGQLFGTRGSGNDSEVYAFATDVDNDQQAEIARMRTLLDTLAGR